MDFLCRNIECRLDRLLSQLIDGKVVPFIGAGVSKPASASNGDNEHGVLDINEMKTMIIKQFISWKNNADNYSNDKAKRYVDWFCRDRGCKKENCKEDNSYVDKEKCKLYEASFSHLCEVYSWIYECCREKNIPHIVDFLGIEKYTRNDPTLAHRYIAFLAREGIIKEVITTNYDTLLEKAYCESFGVNYDGNNSNVSNSNNIIPLKVIANLEDYKKNAYSFQYNDYYNHYINYNNSSLKIYKINGCAQEYKTYLENRTNENLEKVKEKILLTEKQLQDWRDRQWARDLLRDRLRSSTLLFSGFGSDEPQIRHTVLQIAEEYGSYARNNHHNNTHNNTIDYASSLFIAGYAEDLTFNQMQIMYEYLKAYSNNEEISFDRIYSNAFTARDCNFFSTNKKKKLLGLEADLFWMRAYQMVFWRLMRKFCSENSPVYYFLAGISNGASALLNEMLCYYLPQKRDASILSQKQYYFSILPELLDLSYGQDMVLPLMRWVYYVRYGKKDLAGGWYAPISEKPVLIPLIMLFIYAAICKEFSDKNRRTISWDELKKMIIAKDGIFGLKLKLNDSMEVIVLLRHGDCAFHNCDTVELPDIINTKAIIQLLIPGRIEIKPEKIKIRRKLNNDLNGMTIIKEIYVYKMSIGEIFRCRGEMNALRNRLTEILNEAGMIHSQSRKRIKERAKLLLA